MLVTHGKRVDLIAFRGDDNRSSTAQYLQAYTPIEADKLYLTTAESAYKAFLRTIVMDLAHSYNDQGEVVVHRGGEMDWRIYDGEDDDQYITKLIKLAIGSYYKGRTYGTTEKGYMGVFPAVCRVGDLVVVLATGRVPYVLRPIEGDRYTFVGECYVHGIMDGEAMVDGQDLEKFVLV
jgi:hypothetical protein